MRSAENLKKGRRNYTTDEVREHYEFVENMMLTRPGLSDRERARITRERFNFGHKRLLRIQTKIRERWIKESEEKRKGNKQEQINRLFKYIDLARGRRVQVLDKKTREPVYDEEGNPVLEWKEKPNHQALARYEALIAELLGTREPIQVSVEVQMNQAILHVIQGLTPEQEERLFQSYQENVMLADKARALLPPGTIDVPAIEIPAGGE